MEAALLPADSEAGFQFSIDDFNDEWDAVEEPEQDPLDDQMGPWAHKQYLDKYAWKNEDGEPTEVWPDTAYRVVRNVLGALGYTDHDSEFQDLVKFVTERKFMPGGRYLAMAGRQYHPISNCFLYKCDDSREGWADLVRKCILSLSSGGGVGVVYSDVRANGTYIKKTGGLATGPLSPACMVNEVARHVMQGGQRRAAIWAGLHWDHADIFDWIDAKNWSPEVKESKKVASERGDEAPAQLDMTNISVILNDEFFVAFGDTNHLQHDWAQKVYWETVRNMVSTGEPGFSINTGDDVDECLRNPCCEITSESDSDICCLGSINLARVESKKEFAELVNLGSLFLLAGTVYGDTPHDEVRVTREQNRRLGLGLMGVHEWLLVRGHRYEMVDELRDWLGYYEQSTRMAHKWAEVHNLSKPIKTRAIAPTGTIGLIAETTTSAEPIFCAAYKRRFLDTDGKWRHQFVADPTAHRLITEHGVDPDAVEDAYTLAYNVERRIKFQAEMQEYIDQAISSTINLPYPIVDELEVRDFGETLLKYLPRLRGITVYPDGARSGQPLEAIPYTSAIDKVGLTFDDERSSQCTNGSCGV